MQSNKKVDILVKDRMTINQGLQKIIFHELGENSAEIFSRFYYGFSDAEQLEGAREILTLTIGADRTTRLLSKYLK